MSPTFNEEIITYVIDATHTDNLWPDLFRPVSGQRRGYPLAARRHAGLAEYLDALGPAPDALRDPGWAIPHRARGRGSGPHVPHQPAGRDQPRQVQDRRGR